MTRVAGWVQDLTEGVFDEVFGSPPHGHLEIGKRYIHPDDGEIEITGGQYWGTYGLSNFYHWTIVTTGDKGNGYGSRWWPEAGS